MRQDKYVSHSPARTGADPALARWIARTLASDPPRANSLLVTVWGDALSPHGGEAWLATIIRLMAPFGINERAVRTSVFRLARDGWLKAETVGRQSRYHLTPEGARRFQQAHARIYAPPFPHWEGEWEMVVAPPERLDPRVRSQVRDELRWEGFGSLAPGVWARPAHGASAVPRIAAALGIPDRVTAFRARDDATLGGHPLAACVGEAWDLGTLADGYQRFVARFGALRAAWHARRPADPEQAFIVRTLLIHAFRRVLLRDPQLPAQLLPAQWPGTRAYQLAQELYLLAHPLAEDHLARVWDGPLPPAGAAFSARFRTPAG